MSRNISALARQSLFASETDDAFLILLTLSHPDMAAPIRVTSDAAETESNGHIFTPFPFTLTLPDDIDAQSCRAQLTIDNVDRQIVLAVRSLSGAVSALIQIVRAAAPDVIEAQFPDFKLANLSYDAWRVSGDLTVEDFTAEPFPAAIFSPGLFPGLF